MNIGSQAMNLATSGNNMTLQFKSILTQTCRSKQNLLIVDWFLLM